MEFNPSTSRDELLRYAYQLAQGSPDPSTKIGAFVIGNEFRVVGEGCNEFPKGLKVIPEMLERPMKYDYISHAEVNAIFAATRAGEAPLLMVCNWAACMECARAIVQSGIRVLVRHKQASDRSPERWLKSLAVADDLMIQGGVRIIDVDAPNLGAVENLHNGELWTP